MSLEDEAVLNGLFYTNLHRRACANPMFWDWWSYEYGSMLDELTTESERDSFFICMNLALRAWEAALEARDG